MPARKAPASIAPRIVTTMSGSDAAGRRRSGSSVAIEHGGDRAGEVLALPADVEQPAAERERDGEARQHERAPRG